jgi:hypothetical protein
MEKKKFMDGNNIKHKDSKMWTKYFEIISSIILFAGMIMRFCGIKSGLYVMAISVVLTIYCSSWQIERLRRKIEKLERLLSEIQSKDKNE